MELGHRRVNSDVLEAICASVVNTADILSFSLACFTFRAVAVRRLLLSRTFHVKYGRALCEFRDFLLSAHHQPQDAPRLKQLCALKVAAPKPRGDVDDSSSTEALLDILRHATSLRILHVPWDDDYLTDSRVDAAIVGLTGLQELGIHGWCEERPAPIVSLRGLKSPLRRLYLDCYLEPERMSEDEFIPSFLPEIVQALTQISSGIEFLQVTDVIYVQNPWPEARAAPAPIPPASLPNLRSFTATHIRGLPDLGVLMDAFPSLDGALVLEVADSESGPNIPDQESGRRTWTRLRWLEGTLHDLDALGLRCPVDHVIVYMGDPQSAELGLISNDYLADVLRDTTPTRLSLFVHATEKSEFWRNLIPRGEVAGKLTHLKLGVSYFSASDMYREEHMSDPKGSLTWDDLLEGILATLRGLPSLTYLRLMFTCDISYDVKKSKLTYSPAFLEAMRNFDCDGVAATLAGAVPSLLYIFMSTWYKFCEDNGAHPEETAQSKRGWRVSAVRTHPADAGVDVHGPFTPTLERLSDESMEAIIQEEEL